MERIFPPTFQVIPVSFSEEPAPKINEVCAISMILMLL